MALTERQKQAIETAAETLGVDPKHLFALLHFETAGTLDPQIKNPNSSASGLIQFTDSTARWLGFDSAKDLVNKYPDFVGQLLGPVSDYLSRFLPFKSFQDLVMSVFYPSYRRESPEKPFPSNVRESNPGINTVGDYVSRIWDRISLYAEFLPSIIGSVKIESIQWIVIVLMLILLVGLLVI